MRICLLLVLLGLAAALAGCAACGPARRPAPRLSPVSPAASVPGVGHPSRDITLAFAGDVNFARRTRKLLRHPATAFGPIGACSAPPTSPR